MSERFRFSSLDTRRFGVQIYRGSVDDVDTVARVRGLKDEIDVDMLIVRTPIERLDVVQQLEDAGCFLTDTLIYYGGVPKVFDTSSDVSVRGAIASDRMAIEAVARSAFQDFGGHYHRDPRLDSALATEGYVEWALSAFDNESYIVLVATIEDDVAGFMTVSVAADQPAEIVLNGVSVNHQRRGVYAALVRAAFGRLAESGRDRVIVSTQLSNWAPQKVWLRHGLEPYEAHYTFHRWYTPPAEQAG